MDDGRGEDNKTYRDRLLWHMATRDVCTRGFGSEDAPLLPQEGRILEKSSKLLPEILPQTVAPRASPEEGFTGTDRRTSQKFRRGHLPIQARLDLHGLPQDAAHEALQRFILNGVAQGLRMVLVITGKGRRGRNIFSPDPESPSPKGILQSRVPYWLGMPPLRAYILEMAPARPKDGGDGALYVLLKRQRPTK